MESHIIDKIAYVHLVDGKVLVSRSRGKDVWYIPGGKREAGETDEQTLIREVKEELDVDIVADTIEYYGTFQAQAHGRAEGIIVQMACYTADYVGELAAASEIEEIDFFSYDQKHLTATVDHLIFDDLHERGLLK